MEYDQRDRQSADARIYIEGAFLVRIAPTRRGRQDLDDQDGNRALDDALHRRYLRTMSDGLPEQISSYQILGPLGVGGMSQIYRARDIRLGRDVALKVLSDRLVQQPEAVERFLREARAASALNHPNIVTIYEAGAVDGRQFIVMELVKGRTLRAMMQEEPRAIDGLPQIASQAARALAAAHEAGIVHRDIKPENIMVRDDGYVKVVDFGIARLAPTGAADDGTSLTDVATRTGTLLGTPRYMSPEQILSDPLSSATDVFSLGLVLYEWCSGQHPFAAPTIIRMLRAITDDEPLPVARANPLVATTLETLIGDMLQKDPARRPSASEVAERLVSRSSGTARLLRARQERLTVGRQRERTELLEMLDAAASGHPAVMGIAGEPGIGKSTLVDDVLGELAAKKRRWFIARGRCSERLAGTEAYLPFVEALEGLLRGDSRDTVARLMTTLAPTWYQQLSTASSMTGSFEEVRARSQERLKRELLALLTELSASRPVVVFFEDVHWADASTLDLLTYVTMHFEQLRLAFIVTYRPSELELSAHPFLALRRELESRGRAREVALEFLSRDDVAEYLRLTFPAERFPAALPSLIHEKTEGNALFMSDLVRELRDREVIVRDGDAWVLARPVTDFRDELPESIRSMINRKIEGLGKEDHRILLAASVQGAQFDTAIIARALGADAAELEERLDTLERVHDFVRAVGEEPLPDGTRSSQYRFVHVLYQNALYGSLRAVRRAALSGAVANALLSAHRRDPEAIASQVALLFEAAGDYAGAARHFLTAARKAADVFGDREVVILGRHGIDVLAKAIDMADKTQVELQLQLALGVSLTRLKGYASPEVEAAYMRAHTLCERLGDPALLFAVLQGLWRYYCVKGDLRKGAQLAEQLLEFASRTGDNQLVAVAHNAFGTPCLHRGRFDQVLAHAEQALELYDQSQYRRVIAFAGTDIKSGSLNWAALAHWLLGYADRALAAHTRALEHTAILKDPFSEAYTSALGAWLYQYRREPTPALDFADRLLALSTERQFGQWIPFAFMLRGWALSELGGVPEGIAELRKGLAVFKTTSAELNLPHFMSMLVEALCHGDRFDEAGGLVDEAIAVAERNDDRCWEPELFRLKATVLQARDVHDEAERCLRHAVELARGLGAKILELRAWIDLSRLFGGRGGHGSQGGDARDALANVYGWFTEGFETHDLRAARKILAEHEDVSVARMR